MKIDRQAKVADSESIHCPKDADRKAEKADLPIGWIITNIGELYHFEYGKSLIKHSRTDSGEYPVFGSNGIVGKHDNYLIEGPALIVGRKGAAGAVSYSPDNCWPIDTTYFVRDTLNLSLKFSYYLLQSLNLTKHEKSTAIPGLNRNDAYAEPVLLPPLPEQKRIVAKIEELLSELDKGIESFKTAREQLKVYRQALLKHAFEGKLTAAWREANKDKLETADALLKRIQAARAEHHRLQVKEWEKATKEWEKSGKKGKKPGKPSTLKVLPPLTAEELTELPELPDGWGYMRIGGLIDDPTYGTAKKCDYITDGVGVLRIPNVVLGKIDASDLKFAQFSEDEISTYKLFAGDILMIRSNGSISIVGKGAIISETDIGYLFAGYLIRMRPHQKLVKPEYLHFMLSLHSVRKQIEQKAKSTSGVNNINSGEIQSLVVAYCNIEEQDLVVQDLDSRLSEIDNLDQTITTALLQSEALRQSILKKAFSGQLVPQDPDDEPAAVLLARIKAERAVVKPDTKGGRATDRAPTRTRRKKATL